MQITVVTSEPNLVADFRKSAPFDFTATEPVLDPSMFVKSGGKSSGCLSFEIALYRIVLDIGPVIWEVASPVLAALIYDQIVKRSSKTKIEGEDVTTITEIERIIEEKRTAKTHTRREATKIRITKGGSQ